MPNIKNQGLRRVQVLQNRIMRILTGLHYWNTSPSDLLRSFNILNVTERLDCFNCIQVFKCPSNTAPVPGICLTYYTHEENLIPILLEISMIHLIN